MGGGGRNFLSGAGAGVAVPSLRPHCAAGVFASRCRVVVEVSLLVVHSILYGTREAGDWKIHHLLLPVPRVRWVRLHTEFLVQLQRRFCADNYNYFWFKLKGKCRSEKEEVYLNGDSRLKFAPTTTTTSGSS